MKPNFALSLSADGITLYQRAVAGWTLVDEVSLEAADLAGELSSMRALALGLAPEGLQSKLVLPDDQIKFLSFEMPEDRADIDAMVADALEGATPYALSELAFDWSERGDQILVAAVARDTLAEAEGFAQEHQFNPVSFVARPDPALFDGEPFFGLTDGQLALGTPEDAVRDAAAIELVAAAAPPAQPSAPAPDTDQPLIAGESESEADTPVEEVSDPEPSTGDDTAPDPAPEAEAESEAAPESDTPEDTPEAPPSPAFASIRVAPAATQGAPAPLEGVTRDTPPSRMSLADGPASQAPEAPEAPVAAATPATAPKKAADPAPSFFSRRKRSPARTSAPDPKDERQRMTVFGARGTTPVKGKPRYLGLALTVALLLFLIVVAAWASVFGDSRLADFLGGDDTPAVADLDDGTANDDAAFDEAAADLEVASLGPDETPSVLDDPATEILSGVTPADLSPDEAKARYAATGIWQLAPEPPVALEAREMQDVYRTTLERDPNFLDAIALPGADRVLEDALFFAPASPASPDTRYLVDERGLVVATPQGALTPDGVTVYAGKPVAAMPASLMQPPAGQQEATAQTEAAPDADTDARPGPGVVRPVAANRPGTDSAEEATPGEDVTEEPQIATGPRPRPRPDNMAEQIERNELSGRTRNELAALRPKLRPASVQEIAQAKAAAEAEARAEADAKAEAEVLAAAKAQAEAEAKAAAEAAAAAVDPDALDQAVAAAQRQPDPFAGATAQAVRSSVKPNTRPRNFQRTVQRAQQQQQRRQQANRNSREDDAAPRQTVAVRASQKVTPKVPTASGVAKRATQANALKFKRVNLIGVYGTSSNRRALVRLNNGRYQKVKVGDRLDGGRVRAIGDAELSYQKGGRSIVLKMPRG